MNFSRPIVEVHHGGKMGRWVIYYRAAGLGSWIILIVILTYENTM